MLKLEKEVDTEKAILELNETDVKQILSVLKTATQGKVYVAKKTAKSGVCIWCNRRQAEHEGARHKFEFTWTLSDEILKEAGLTEAKIAKLKDVGKTSSNDTIKTKGAKAGNAKTGQSNNEETWA